MTYEIERVYLTDDDGNPIQVRDEAYHAVEAFSAKGAALLFIEQDGARLLGSICEAPGDQCTAIGWEKSRAFAITVWRDGERPAQRGQAGLPALEER